MKSIKIFLYLFLLSGVCAFGMNSNVVTRPKMTDRMSTNDSTAFVRYFKQKALAQSIKDSLAAVRQDTLKVALKK